MAFSYKTLNELQDALGKMNLALPLSEDAGILAGAFSFGGLNVPNRFAVQPMEGCDGNPDGSPSELTMRRYHRFAAGGAGLLWFEATAVVPEAKANPLQLMLTEENLDAFKSAVEDMRETARRACGHEIAVIMQATHSGRYSKPAAGKPMPIIMRRNPIFESKAPDLPYRIITDDELKRLEERFGEMTRLAEQAGFDGIDIKACHGYLLCESLSAFTREGEYGGCFENRTRAYTNSIRSAISAKTKQEFLITSRLTAYDGFPHPYGFGAASGGGEGVDLTEPLRLIDILHNELGINALNLTMGNPYQNPHVNRPFDNGAYTPPEHPLQGVARVYEITEKIAKEFPALSIMASAPSYLRALSVHLAAGAVEANVCDIVGFGRMAFAYPDFAKDFLSGSVDAKQCCIACSKCSQIMRGGGKAGCAIRDSVYTEIYRKLCAE